MDAKGDRTQMSWQRANILAAANYLKDQIAAGADDQRINAVYQGLLEVLEPARRTMRLQREMAESARAAMKVRHKEHRSGRERRSGVDRREIELGNPTGPEQRLAGNRRSGSDRRSRT